MKTFTVPMVTLVSALLPLTAEAKNCAAYTDPIAQIRCFKEQQSGGTYKAPESKLLTCDVNVNCRSKDEVVKKMRTAWTKLRSAGGVAGAYADVCFSALKNVQSLHPSIKITPNIMSPQLDACNAGLRELR
jgi:hypothetical protein